MKSYLLVGLYIVVALMPIIFVSSLIKIIKAVQEKKSTKYLMYICIGSFEVLVLTFLALIKGLY